MNEHMTSIPGLGEKAFVSYRLMPGFANSWSEDVVSNAPTRSHSRQPAGRLLMDEHAPPNKMQFVPYSVLNDDPVVQASSVKLLYDAFFRAAPHHHALALRSMLASTSDISAVLSYVANTSPASTAYSEQDQTLPLHKLEQAAEYTRRHERSSELVNFIVAERSYAEIDTESVEIADAAKDDALVVVQRANLGGKPRVMFSDDGILTLQWQRGEYGVALIFAGDGMASIAIRRPGQLYADNGIEVAISDELPAQFFNVLANAI